MVKSYKGGYSILDTTPITFEAEDSGVAITDTYILEQLLEILKPHYYNWKKDLKPIYLRYISDSVGVCVALCTLVHQSDNEFYINANLSHDTIQIYVELTEDVDGNILINDCTYSYPTLTQVVNTEITGGNIEVGTKLYLHKITLSDTTIINIISTNNGEVTSLNDLQDIYANCINAQYYDQDEYVQSVLFIDRSILVFYSNSTESIENVTLTGMTLTDTVTPL